MNLDDVYDGISFEDYVQLLFSSEGLDATTTPISNDYGADLIVKNDGLTFSIQCKFYERPVGVKAVQEVMGSLNYYNADYGVVITNSTFTQQAQNLAHTNNILLIDGDALNGSLKVALDDFAKKPRSASGAVPHRYSNGWTMEDLMIRYGQSRNSIIKNYMSQGLPFEKIGREYRFSEEAVKEWEISKRGTWIGNNLPENVKYFKEKYAELRDAEVRGDREAASALRAELRRLDPRHYNYYAKKINAPLVWILLGVSIVFIIIVWVILISIFEK